MYSALPHEVLVLIAGHLNSPTDLLSYLGTDSLHYHLLINILYRMNVRFDGGSALVWFARRGSARGVRSMLAAGANVNVRGPTRSQSTALVEAVFHKHTHVVRILLENGAIPDMTYLYCRRPLILATRGHCDLIVTKLLLEYGANVNQTKRDTYSPLLEAVRSNQEPKVALLLQHGAKICITERQHAMSLLHIAAEANATPEIFQMLLRAYILTADDPNGCRWDGPVNSEDLFSRRTLAVAASPGREIRRRVVDSQDGLGRTPLQVAAGNSCLRAVKELLNCGADPNFKNMNERTKGWTALFYASGAKYTKKPLKAIVGTLLRYGADIDARNDVGQTPLLHAISQGAITQARELLDQGASIVARDA